jgi:hypothetical protein
VSRTRDGKFYLPFTLFEYNKENKSLSLKKYLDNTSLNDTSHMYYIPINGGMTQVIIVDANNSTGIQPDVSDKKYIGIKLSGTHSMSMYTHTDPNKITSVDTIGKSLSNTYVTDKHKVNSEKDKLTQVYYSNTNNLVTAKSISDGVSQPTIYLVSFMITISCMSFIYGFYISCKDYITPSKPYPSIVGQKLMESVHKGDEYL